MFRILVPLSLLLLATPLAAADVVCVGDATTVCAIVQPSDRFSWYGVDVYDSGTGTFATAGYGEGSGFFADTATSVVFAYNPASGQWVVFVVAMNDYDRDGTYEDFGANVGTWNDDAAMPAVGQGYYTPLP